MGYGREVEAQRFGEYGKNLFFRKIQSEISGAQPHRAVLVIGLDGNAPDLRLYLHGKGLKGDRNVRCVPHDGRLQLNAPFGRHIHQRSQIEGKNRLRQIGVSLRRRDRFAAGDGGERTESFRRYREPRLRLPHRHGHAQNFHAQPVFARRQFAQQR